MTDEHEVKKTPPQLYPEKIVFPPLEGQKEFVIQDVPESELKAGANSLPKFHLRKRY